MGPERTALSRKQLRKASAYARIIPLQKQPSPPLRGQGCSRLFFFLAF